MNCAKHYYCVSPQNYTGLTGLLAIGIFAGALTLIEVALLVFAGSAIPGFGIVAAVLFMAAVFELCDFLHGGKLICLKTSSCSIGRIAEFILVGQDKSGFEKMDDDFTFNIMLSPHSPLETQNEIVMSDPYQGPFINEQNDTHNLGLGYEGQDVQFTNLNGHRTEVLHCEIKGCRVHDCCAVLKAMSFVGLGVGVICSIPLLGWIACPLAAAIWLAVTAAAFGIAWAATHNGQLNDVYDPAAGSLRAADPANGEGGDVVLVRGDWVYDAGHGGWNEVHPVRSIQKLTDVVDQRFRGMGKASPTLVEDFKREVLDVWCFYAGQVDDPDVQDAQDDPKNDWDIHPGVDGCKGKGKGKDKDKDKDDDKQGGID